MSRNKEWDDYGIGACNRMVAKDAALLLGCCAVTIAGTYGIINLSQDVIEYCNVGNIMDFQMKVEESLKMSGAVCSAFFGGCGTYLSGRSLQKTLKFRNDKKEGIANSPCIGNIRNYNR